MLKFSLCYQSDSYILVTKINGKGNNADVRQADERNKDVILKNCAPFTNCESEISNMEIDNAKDIDIVKEPMICLIKIQSENITFIIFPLQP